MYFKYSSLVIVFNLNFLFNDIYSGDRWLFVSISANVYIFLSDNSSWCDNSFFSDNSSWCDNSFFSDNSFLSDNSFFSDIIRYNNI